ncbi:MAG TPA: magnesium/cobalt transporter CorA [Methanomicrobia archaeon]|mgnify:CR=1 FL=1|nr:magnesium/cobalt transporter CorA [Methanomicrobia archaeon]
MPQLITKRSKKSGLPPGTLIHIGERKTEKVRITLIDYDEAQLEEREVARVEEVFSFKERPTVTWINIDGVHDVELIRAIGQHFGVHPLLLEDILNTEQRPKMDDYESYLFLVLKMLYYNGEEREIEAEQVSLIIGPNFVISFQECEGDVFNSVRDRIRNKKGRIRKAGPDYLAYALIDAIVDNYFVILEKIGEVIEDTEEELVSTPSPETLRTIHGLKRGMIFLRKSIWPLREVLSGLERLDSPLIQESTDIYLRDLYDHTIQVIDTVENYRDMIAGMLDIYLSSLSNKMNEIMKVLTIIATIFIPLTYIAGVYGMNFEYMPELGWRWGYLAVWLVMGAILISMVLYFRRRGWL